MYDVDSCEIVKKAFIEDINKFKYSFLNDNL